VADPSAVLHAAATSAVATVVRITRVVRVTPAG
jgi:hypothetical protein